jgi:CMP/dCMP kinase
VTDELDSTTQSPTASRTSSARAGSAASPARTVTSGEPAGAGSTAETAETAETAGGLTVAIDGPGSSGKSTIGAAAARRLHYRFCDTGLLYRAVTRLALDRGVAPSEIDRLVPLVAEVQLVPDGRGRFRHVEVGGRDVTSEVSGAAVDRAVSDYARVPELRAALVPRQRALAADGGIIMAGRDIGTVILPHADVKIFLSATPEERARRRAVQRRVTTDGETDQILHELRRRDSIDSSRETAPLLAAPDAVVIHTDGNTFEQTVRAVTDAIRAAGVRGRGR